MDSPERDGNNASSYSRVRRNIVTRAERSSFASFEFVKDFRSTAYLRIEVPLPLRTAKNFAKNVSKTFTGDPRGTWTDFVSGEKLSFISQRISFLITAFVYISLQYLFFNNPPGFIKFYSVIYMGLLVAMAEAHSKTGRIFKLLDFNILSSVICLASLVANKSPEVWRVSFSLSVGLPILKSFISPQSNAIVMGTDSTMTRLFDVLCNFMPSLVLYVAKDIRAQEDNGYFGSDTQSSFIVPMSIAIGWVFFSVFISEGMCRHMLYHETDPIIQKEASTFKEVLGYYKPQNQRPFSRLLLERLLTSLRLLSSGEKYMPDTNTPRARWHHALGVVFYNIVSLSVILALLPLGSFFASNPVLFKLCVVLNLVKLVYNGAAISFPDPDKIEIPEPEEDIAMGRQETIKEFLEKEVFSDDSDVEGDSLSRHSRDSAPPERNQEIPMHHRAQESFMSNQTGITKEI